MKRKLLAGIAMLGIIILGVGLYYAMIKAGIPYQDPTQEMIEQYNRDAATGGVLTVIGICVEGICGLAFLVGVVKKKCKQKTKP